MFGLLYSFHGSVPYYQYVCKHTFWSKAAFITQLQAHVKLRLKRSFRPKACCHKRSFNAIGRFWALGTFFHVAISLAYGGVRTPFEAHSIIGMISED